MSMSQKNIPRPYFRRLCLVLLLVLGGLVYRAWHPHPPDPNQVASAPLGPHRMVASRAGTTRPWAPRIVGRVLDAIRHTPLSGAVLSLETVLSDRPGDEIPVGESRPPRHVRSDAQGRFVLALDRDPWEESPPRRLRITATLPGYLPALRELALADEASVELLLDPGGLALSGTVSEVDGGVVPGALVYARAETDNLSLQSPRYAALTDDQGHYRLDLAPSDYIITFAAADYVGARRSVRLRRVPVRLDIVLTPGAGVSGVVLTAAHQPLGDAVVSARGGMASSSRWFDWAQPEVRTDAAGRFHLRGLGSGPITLDVHGKGGATREPVPLDLDLGEERSGVVIVVDPAFTLSGRVMEADPSNRGSGLPIAGATIHLTQGLLVRMAARRVTSDAAGRFVIEGLLPANYGVSVSAPGYLPIEQVSLRQPARDRNDVVFALRRGRTLRGRVEPPTQAQVFFTAQTPLRALLTFSLGGREPIRTDAQGRFELRGIPEGSGQVVATTADDRRGTAPVNESHGDVEGLVIALAQTAAVEGQVLDDRGVPVGEVHVSAGPEPSSAWRSLFSVSHTVVASDGRFVLTGLEPGTYELSVRRMFETVPVIAPALVSVRSGEVKRDVVLRVESLGGSLQGQVLASDGTPAPDCWVECAPIDDSLGLQVRTLTLPLRRIPPVLTDQKGYFMVRGLLQARYQCTAEKHGERAESDSLALGTGAILRLQGLASLSGRVHIRGVPVTRYYLQVDSVQLQFQERNVTAADGRYQVDRLVPGKYQVQARSDQGTAVGWIDLEHQAKTLDLELVPLGSLRGRVVDVRTGEGIAGVALQASSALPSDPFAVRSWLAEDTDTLPVTDSQGRFEIPRVQAGYGQVTVLRGRVGAEVSNEAIALGQTSYEMEGTGPLDIGEIQVVDAPSPGSFERGTLDCEVTTDAQRLLVSALDPGGVAQAGGLAVGDEIVAIDGLSVADGGAELVGRLLASDRIRRDQLVQLKVMRDGSALSFVIRAR